MSDLVIYADRGSLLNRLKHLSMTACSCSPKTSFIRDHSRGCQWRIYQEAIILLKSDSAEIERLQAIIDDEVYRCPNCKYDFVALIYSMSCLLKRNELLEKVVEAAQNVSNHHSRDYPALTKALAALKEQT